MPVDRLFMAKMYEVFLGRGSEDEQAVTDRVHWPVDEVIASFLRSDEFRGVMDRLTTDADSPHDSFHHGIMPGHRYWIMDTLPILAETVIAVRDAGSWAEIVRHLVGDRRLMAAAGMETVNLPVDRPARRTGGSAYPVELVWSDDR